MTPDFCMTSQNSPELFDKFLIISCQQITLKKKSLCSPMVYQGFGSISRTSKGYLELRLSYYDENNWASLQETLEESGERLGNITAISDKSSGIGEVIPETELFSLFATDLQGREWTSTDVLIRDTEYQNKQTTLLAQLYEISHTDHLLSNEDAYMCLQLNEDIKVPSNKFIKTGKDLQDFAYITAFSACEYNFIIKYVNNSTILEVASNCNIISDFVETRICEALQFIIGDLVSWSALELIQCKQKTIRIRPYLNRSKAIKIQPPIRFEKLDSTKDIWNLYEKYLRYVLNYSKREFHPVSGWSKQLIESRTTSLETEMLTLSVAIESLLERQFPQEAFTDSNSNNIELQLSLVKEKINELQLDETFRNRLEGLLNSMKQMRAKDRLWDLVYKCLIDEELVKAWGRVRNSAAHGNVLDPKKIEVYLKLCNQVTILFHHLVFLIIGYTGRYTEYRVEGWPKKEFNKLFNKSN